MIVYTATKARFQTRGNPYKVPSIKIVYETALARARRLNAIVTELKLESQFRCNGSDGYLAWLDNALQVADTANETLASLHTAQAAPSIHGWKALAKKDPAAAKPQAFSCVAKTPRRGRAKPLCGLCVTMPPEGRPLCGRKTSRLCQCRIGASGLQTAIRSFPAKKYTSKKKYAPDGAWQHEEIILQPLNPEYKDIVIPNAEDEEFVVVAEVLFVAGR